MDVDAIIKGLSEAQKAVLRSAEKNGLSYASIVPEWAWPIHAEFRDRSHRVVGDGRAFTSLAAKPMRRLVAASPRPTETGRVLYFSLTPIGLAVRARLLEEGK